MHTLTFYPVGNGDTSQIVLENGRRLLFDFRHQNFHTNDPKSPVIDLAAQLRSELKAANRNDFDVVAFTHADLDHIGGFSDFFELQAYPDTHGGDRVKMKEIWVPAAVLIEPATHDQKQDEFYILRQEARHRLKKGIGIKVFSKIDFLVGFLRDAGIDPATRAHCFVDAGTLVSGFSLQQDAMEVFVHSPFVEHCDGRDFERNEASLVFNVRFAVGEKRYDYFCVGDSKYEALARIVDITKFHNREDRLGWDIYSVPHHCSYLALGPEKGDRETEPVAQVAELLLYGKKGSYVVSSSNTIPNTGAAYGEVQPPHIQARNTYETYLNKVGGRKFLVTMEYPNGFNPRPMIFNIDHMGIRIMENSMPASVGIVAERGLRAG